MASFVTVGEIISDGNDPISFVLVGLAFVSGLASFVASDSKAQELYLRYTRASNAFKELILECRFEGLHQSDPAEARRRAQLVFDALNTGWADVVRSGDESSETKPAD